MDLDTEVTGLVDAAFSAVKALHDVAEAMERIGIDRAAKEIRVHTNALLERAHAILMLKAASEDGEGDR